MKKEGSLGDPSFFNFIYQLVFLRALFCPMDRLALI